MLASTRRWYQRALWVTWRKRKRNGKESNQTVLQACHLPGSWQSKPWVILASFPLPARSGYGLQVHRGVLWTSLDTFQMKPFSIMYLHSHTFILLHGWYFLLLLCLDRVSGDPGLPQTCDLWIWSTYLHFLSSRITDVNYHPWFV